MRTRNLPIDQSSLFELLNNLYEALYIVDKDCKILYWNKAAELITGFHQQEVMGRNCSDILSHIDEKGNVLCDRCCPLKLSMSDGRIYEIEAFLRHKDGHMVPVSVRTCPLSNDSASGAVEVFVDNSSKIAFLHRIEELQRLVIIDHLTGLTNRRFIEMSLEARLSEMKRYGWPFGVLFIDIDNFKNINDLYGHETGDNVLRMIAQTFINNSRPFDTTGRWGGEEFVSIILNVDKERLFDVANRMRMLIEQSVITIDSDLIKITVSIGATMANSEDTVESIIRRADRLMYHGKITGKNRVIID
ncbi:MAG: diguanylate cyclase [Thermodesulfovibrionales bacterium]